jgi:hypothetical protein
MTPFSDNSYKSFFAKEHDILNRVVKIFGVINLSFEISFNILSYNFESINVWLSIFSLIFSNY